MTKAKRISLVIWCLMAYISPLYAQSFDVMDYNELITKHKLAEKYDQNTGRFLDTFSEILPIPELEKRIETTQTQINFCEQQIANLSKEVFFDALTNTDEEPLWNKIAILDKKIDDLKKQLENDQTQLNVYGGIPPIQTVHELIKQILNDTSQIINKSDSDYLFNLLPPPALSPPHIRPCESLMSFFFDKNKSTLKQYIRYPFYFNAFSVNSVNPILYQKGNEHEE